MTDWEDADDPADSGNGAPIDFDRLEVSRERFATDDRFVRIEEQPEFAPDRLVCVYDSQFYPDSVQQAHLEVVWYENGDFLLHYHEDHRDGTSDHRWGRHLSGHNRRDHVHPGPDAPTPVEDADHSEDWRDVLS